MHTCRFSTLTQNCFWCLKEQFSANIDAVHFTIHLEENSSSHSCQLVRLPCTSVNYPCSADGFTYRLYVDQTPIMEHSMDATMTVGVPEDLHCDEAAAASAAGPPTYYESLDDIDNNQLPPYDD